MDHRETVILDFPRGIVRARYLLQPRQLQGRLIARFSPLTSHTARLYPREKNRRYRHPEDLIVASRQERHVTLVVQARRTR